MAKTNKVQIKITAKNQTKAAFQSVTKGLKGIASAAFSMKSAIGVAAGLTGLGYLAKKSMDATDQLGKTAQKIGMTTEALGGLRYAAQLTGVAANTMDMAMQRMVRRISEAANGSGEAKDALKELGLSAQALATLSPDQQFKLIADAMEQVTNQGDRVRLAMRLFDSEGVALVNTLKGGSKAILEMQQEAKDLGLLMNDTLVNDVEAANDSIQALTSFLKMGFTRIVAELAPRIKDVTDNIREWLSIKLTSGGGVAGVAEQIATVVEDIYNWSLKASQGLNTMFTTFANWSNAIDTKLLANYRSEIAELENRATHLQEVLGEGFHTTIGLFARTGHGSVEAVYEEIDEIGVKLSAAWTKVEALSQRITKPLTQKITIKEQTAQTPGAGQATNAQLRQAYGWLNAVTTIYNEDVAAHKAAWDAKLTSAYASYGKMRTYGEQQSSAEQAADSAAWNKKLSSAYMAYGKMRTYGERQNALELAAEKEAWNKKLTVAYQAHGKFRLLGEKHAIDTRSAFEKAADGIENAYEAMQDSVENTLTDMLVSGGSWKDAMMDIADMVYREFVRVQIAAPLAEAGNSFLKDFFNGIFQAPGASAPMGGAGRALGGPVLNDRSYIVGENGPEVFTPGQKGHISPNASTPVNITYNIKSWDSRDTMTAIQSSAPQIVGIVQQAFNKHGQRGFA